MSKKDKVRIVVPWHCRGVKDEFLEAWGEDSRLLLRQDRYGEGCARSKNAGISAAMEGGADVVLILDDDMRPSVTCPTLDDLVNQHLMALQPQEVAMFQAVADPPNRGTPYFQRTMSLPVACSLGWWSHIPDRDAARQLVEGAEAAMAFDRRPVFRRWFAGSGMNIAFRPREWWPWCQFIEDVGRFDDIWMFNLWAKEAYRRNFCFSFAGPTLVHARQSHVFANLRDEAGRLEQNETVWRDIACSPSADYRELRALLPP